MIFGTIKSEVFALDKDYGQEVFRYEVITRWWQNKAGDGFEWKHTIIRINREGDVQRFEDFRKPDDWWDAFYKHRDMSITSWSYDDYSTGRTKMVDQHHWIVRHCVA